MENKEITESFETEYDETCSVSDWDENDEEWLKYCKDVDEYNDEVEDYNEYDYSYTQRVLKPSPLIDDFELEEDYVVLGTFKYVPKVKKSFKYTNKCFKIFCPSVLKYEKCNNTRCKLFHSFLELSYCTGNCNKIVYENNFYLGTCFKRHKKETFENYAFRKQIKLKFQNVLTFDLFERPSIDLLTMLLNTAKNLNVKSLKLKFVRKPITLDDFYKNF